MSEQDADQRDDFCEYAAAVTGLSAEEIGRDVMEAEIITVAGLKAIIESGLDPSDEDLAKLAAVESDRQRWEAIAFFISGACSMSQAIELAKTPIQSN